VLSTVRRRGRAKQGKPRLTVATAVALLSLGGGVALAANGGGIGAPKPPAVTDVTCQNRCAGLREATAGSRIQLRGRDLEYVSEVRFNQRGGGRVASAPQKVSSSSVEAIVPDEAETGKPEVADAGGAVAQSPAELVIVAPGEVQSSDGAGVSDVFADPDKGFFAGRKQASAAFVAQGGGPQDVRVDVISSEGAVVRSMVQEDVEPQSPVNVRWNGKTEEGEVAPNGEYDFEVKPLAGGDGAKARFEQYDHVFPVRGKHGYGDGLGAGRGHQGGDVFADCGTRMKAARAGKVQWKQYHAAAGNYLVIDGKKTGVDYMYAHLQQPSKFGEGDKVKTGQTIGRVGETGNAQGCHLHFEMWDGEWQGGGSVIDPMPHLRRWDGWS
jgi:murein DD-endopeptidase MepM/ murein hydrolase activator NlpD